MAVLKIRMAGIIWFKTLSPTGKKIIKTTKALQIEAPLLFKKLLFEC